MLWRKDMEANSSYDFILIGLAVRLLKHSGTKVSRGFISRHIEMLQERLQGANFVVSLEGMIKLKELNDKLKEEEELDDLVDLDTISTLEREMDLMERVIFSEAGTKKVYTLPDRRYNSDSLLNNPQNIFKGGVFDKLSDMAKFDIRSGCRCLLFGEATAAAFHILRATEDTLKQYYFLYKKTGRLKKPMWGPMTLELRKKTRKKPPQLILDSLDLVRVSYRNPTQHPDVKYDIDSAQDLFGVCVDLISKMSVEL